MNIEDLDQALTAITPRPAPVDAAIRHGRLIRWRRRTVAAVTVAAAAAAAVILPQTLHVTAAPPPASGYQVSEQPPGQRFPADEIAHGTVNGRQWSVRYDMPCMSASRGRACAWVRGIDAQAAGSPELTQMPPLAPDPAVPVNFAGSGGTALDVQYGAVRADVAYLMVRFGNGIVLILHPVLIHGTRLVAFAEPPGAPLTISAYSRAGLIATAFPLIRPSHGAEIGAWIRPGQPVPPTATGRVGDLTAYVGPWGTCLAGSDSDTCWPTWTATRTEVASELTGGSIDGTIVLGTATAQVSRIVVTYSGGGGQTVYPVDIGGERLWTTSTPSGRRDRHWTAFDAAGNVVARG